MKASRAIAAFLALVAGGTLGACGGSQPSSTASAPTAATVSNPPASQSSSETGASTPAVESAPVTESAPAAQGGKVTKEQHIEEFYYIQLAYLQEYISRQATEKEKALERAYAACFVDHYYDQLTDEELAEVYREFRRGTPVTDEALFEKMAELSAPCRELPRGGR